MKRSMLTVLLLTVFSIGNTQVQTIFPLAAKQGMKSGGFALNGSYAFLTNADYPTHDINISVYNVTSRKPVKNLALSNDQNMEPWNISNDGKHVLMYVPNSHNLTYDVISDSLTRTNKNVLLSKHPLVSRICTICFFRMERILMIFMISGLRNIMRYVQIKETWNCLIALQNKPN